MVSVPMVWKGIVLTSGLLLLAACGSSAAASGAAPSTPAETAITVTGNEFSFTPGNLTAKVGQPVKVVFTNAGKIDHDWAIVKIPVSDEHAEEAAASGAADAHADDHAHADSMPAVHVAAKVGTSSTVEFIPFETGDYEITCTIPGHTESGMRGTLKVLQ